MSSQGIFISIMAALVVGAMSPGPSFVVGPGSPFHGHGWTDLRQRLAWVPVVWCLPCWRWPG